MDMKGHNNRNLMANGMAAVLSCMALFSCSDKDFRGTDTAEVCDNISFGISSDSQQGRSVDAGDGAESGCISGRFVLRSADSEDTLCVRTIVTDGIWTASGPTHGKTIQRGTPVTKDAFYNAFRVVADWKKDGENMQAFFMDETVTDKYNNNRWSSSATYYWPGVGHTLQFYAWAPEEVNNTGLSLSYTVNENVSAQQDVVVAKTAELGGEYNQLVPLAFQHICTAVRFVTGTPMQQGSIKSVALKGVFGSGEFDMTNTQWTLGNTVQDFTLSFDPAKAVSGTGEASITDNSQTFLMLPQTLPAGAEVEVAFSDASTRQDRTLTASIAGTVWTMGTTVTYKLSITPEYELEFVTADPTLDAHYVMYPIVVKADKLDDGKKWSVHVATSEGDNGDWARLKWKSDLIELEEQGFWIDNEDATYIKQGKTRVASLEAAGNVASDTLFVFLDENITDTDRKVDLTIKVDDNVVDRLTITQYAAGLVGDKYVERIDDLMPFDTPEVPWGFSWSTDNNIEFKYTGSGSASGKLPGSHSDALKVALEAMGISATGDNPICIVPGKNESGNVVINLASLKINNIAMSMEDGFENTWEVYSVEGVKQLNSILNMLLDYQDLELVAGSISDLQNPSDFAAYSALKKNKFSLRETITTTENGQTVVLQPVLEKEAAKWYLPAVSEYQAIATAGEYLSTGVYWTSTAVSDESASGANMTQAYVHGQTPDVDSRDKLHKIRAMRIK